MECEPPVVRSARTGRIRHFSKLLLVSATDTDLALTQMVQVRGCQGQITDEHALGISSILAAIPVRYAYISAGKDPPPPPPPGGVGGGAPPKPKGGRN